MPTHTLGNAISVDPILVLCAVRYALPRNSYISPTMAGELVRISKDLSEEDRFLVLRDIVAGTRTAHVGATDLSAWQSAVDALLSDAAPETLTRLEREPDWFPQLSTRMTPGQTGGF